MCKELSDSISSMSDRNSPFFVITGVRIPAVPRVVKYSGLISGMNFLTRLTIIVFDKELFHSFDTKDKNSLFSKSFFELPDKICPSFFIDLMGLPTPEYVSGPNTGTALGPISVVPSDLFIQCGSKNGKLGNLATV